MGTVCADLTTDLANCGACGQSCVACESCLAGVCSADSFLLALSPLSFGDGGLGFVDRLAVGDFNADGKNDVAMMAYGSETLEIAFRDGKGGFPNSQLYSISYPAYDLAAGDVNGDGFTDLVIAILGTQASDTGSGFLVFAGLADGGLSATGPFESNPSETPSSTSNGVLSMVVADFNSDGIADVAIGNPGQGADVFYGLPDGGFDKSAAVFSGIHSGWPPELSAGDVNGDGRADLSVLTDKALAVLVQTPDGGLGQATTTTSVEGIAVIAGGLLVAVDFFGYDLVAYQVDTYGNITLFQTYSISGPSGVLGVGAGLAVDMNQDGITDLVISGYGSSALWLGHGPDAGFDLDSNFDIGGAIGEMAAGDLNGDGRPDLVAAGAGATGDTSVLVNECVP
jgi:hypothetical protein